MICKINIVVCQTDQNKEMPVVFFDPVVKWVFHTHLQGRKLEKPWKVHQQIPVV